MTLRVFAACCLVSAVMWLAVVAACWAVVR